MSCMDDGTQRRLYGVSFDSRLIDYSLGQVWTSVHFVWFMMAVF